MPSKREAALDAFLVLLQTIPAVSVRRGGEMPSRIPPSGQIILRDGEPGEPEITLSPLLYEYRHTVDVEVILQPVAGVDRTDALDAVLVQVGAAIEADRTLGGVCEWVEANAPITDNLALEGVADIIAAVVPVDLIYITTGPLA